MIGDKHVQHVIVVNNVGIYNTIEYIIILLLLIY